MSKISKPSVEKDDIKNARFISEKLLSSKIMLFAVKADGTNIQYIKNPSKEVQLAAIQENRDSYFMIKKPDFEVKKYMLESDVEYVSTDFKEVSISLDDMLSELKDLDQCSQLDKLTNGVVKENEVVEDIKEKSTNRRRQR